MHISDPQIQKLEAELEALNKEWRTIREKAKAKKKELDAAVVGEQLDHWGVNAEQYAKARELAKANGHPLHVVLNEARKAANKARRESQTAKATPATTGVAGAGVG